MIYFNETHIYLGFIWCVAIGLKNKTAFLKKPIIYNGEGLLAWEIFINTQNNLSQCATMANVLA